MNWTEVSYTASISTQGITGGKGHLKEFLYYPDPLLVGIVSCVPSLHRGKSHLCPSRALTLLPPLSCHCPGAEVTTLLLLWPLASTAGQEHNKEGGKKQKPQHGTISRCHHKS